MSLAMTKISLRNGNQTSHIFYKFPLKHSLYMALLEYKFVRLLTNRRNKNRNMCLKHVVIEYGIALEKSDTDFFSLLAPETPNNVPYELRSYAYRNKIWKYMVPYLAF